VNASDDEHPIFRLFDFSPNFSLQLAVGLNLARLQRASEGTKQSTRDGCNQIIYGRGVGFSKILCLHSIVFSNRSMHTEDHCPGFAGKLRVANWTSFSLYVRLRNIRNFSHGSSPAP
jgi:hypothetical protein